MKNRPSTTLEQKRDRRGLLALIGAGGVAAVAAVFSRSNGAQAGHGPADATNALHLGAKNNAGGSRTILRSDLPETTPGLDALRVANLFPGGAADGGGLGLAIHGRGTRHGVFGTSVRGPSGVIGFAFDLGPEGPLPKPFGAKMQAGVLGIGGPNGFPKAGGNAAGVLGLSRQTGVEGRGKKGVRGEGNGASGSIGVLAKNSGTRQALRVGGRASFKQAGKTTIGAGEIETEKTLPFNLASGSLVVATLQNDAGSDIVVRLARKSAKNKIRIVLNNAVASGKTARVAYFIFTA